MSEGRKVCLDPWLRMRGSFVDQLGVLVWRRGERLENLSEDVRRDWFENSAEVEGCSKTGREKQSEESEEHGAWVTCLSTYAQGRTRGRGQEGEERVSVHVCHCSRSPETFLEHVP